VERVAQSRSGNDRVEEKAPLEECAVRQKSLGLLLLLFLLLLLVLKNSSSSSSSRLGALLGRDPEFGGKCGESFSSLILGVYLKF